MKKTTKKGHGFLINDRVINGERQLSKFEQPVLAKMQERNGIRQEETIDIDCEIIDDEEEVIE